MKKKKTWGNHMARTEKRLNSDKNDMFYDSKACMETWEDCGNRLREGKENPKSIYEHVKFVAMLAVYESIQENGILPLRQAHEIYADTYRKEVSTRNSNPSTHLKCPEFRYKSTDVRDRFLTNLPTILFYCGAEGNNVVSYLVPRGHIPWDRLIHELDLPRKEELTRKHIQQKLKDSIKPALEYASNARDRHLLKLIFTEITSMKYMESGKLGLKMNHSCLKSSNDFTQKNTVPNNQGDKSKYKQRKEKLSKTGRVDGSGRPFKCHQYPKMTEIMLQLFDSAGLGFQSHPRLICETLYLDKDTSWMNMTRVHRILTEILGYQVSKSCLYTYTENFKSGTYQAKRHHENKGVNPNICLKKATRDGHVDKSINSHYQSADMNYALADICRRGGMRVGRDNKALVYTDVQIVQRPSKSWVRIQYEDHDFKKETQRSLTISTYQIQSASELGNVEGNMNKYDGQGACIVKMHFFEKESAFRHLNELFYLMSCDDMMEHFLKDGALVTEMVITVDNGPDEKPDSRLTLACAVLMRIFLKLNRVLIIAHSEGDSKYHTTERLHVPLNAALSQGGAVSSHSVHKSEFTSGCFDLEKFKANMKYARDEVVQRLKPVTYKGKPFKVLTAQDEPEWVLSEDSITKMRKLLKDKTEAEHIQENFAIRPQGKTWDKVCQMYGLRNEVLLPVARLIREIDDPVHTWASRYKFATYSSQNDWIGPNYRPYELSPVLDITQLPDYRYLTYEQLCGIEAIFKESDHVEMPTWLIGPDFSLPSKNIERYLDEDPQIFSDPDRLQDLCNVTGVEPSRVKQYVADLEEKDKQFLERKEVVKKYAETLAKFKVPELKTHLAIYKVKLTREQERKADLLVALDNELQRRQISLDQFMKDNFKGKRRGK